jgi:hypothetical protein
MKTTRAVRGIGWLFVLLVVGCGGGGGGGTGGGGNGTITDEQRSAVFTSIEQKLDSLSGQDPAADRRAMLAFLKSLPEVRDAGVDDSYGSLWGLFKDDVPFIVSNHGQTLGRSAAPLVPGLARAAELPTNARARILSVMGTSATARLRTWLPANGYALAPTAAGIDALRTVSGDGVFYIDTHGATGKIGKSGERLCAIWSATNRTIALDAKFRAEGDLDPEHPRLVHFVASSIGASAQTRYAFTHYFVDRYMSFGKNSLVYIDACTSNSTDAVTLRQAFHRKGAALYVGWTQEVLVEEADRAAMFVFDRLIGGNQDPNAIETPPQRPFSWQSVYNDLRARGYDTSPNIPEDAKLVFSPNPDVQGNDFALLAPSIDYMKAIAVSASDYELRIRGIFGTRQGTVSINGANVAVKSWGPSELRCLLPAHDQPGGYGDVVVAVDGHKSNPVQLSMWELTFTHIMQRDFSYKYVTQEPGPPNYVTHYAERIGNLMVTTTSKVYVRADAHESRDSSGQKPPFSPPVRDFVVTLGNPTKDAKVTSVRVSGSATEEHTNDKYSDTVTYFNKYSLNGASTIALDGSDGRGVAGNIYGELNMAKRQMALVFGANLGVVHIERWTDPPGAGGVDMVPRTVALWWSQITPIVLDGNYNIVTGSKSEVVEGPQAGDTTTLSVSWSGKIFSPPNPNSPRSARITAKR